MQRYLSLDIGGTTIDSAVVDPRDGNLLTEVRETPTPQGSCDEVIEAIQSVIKSHTDADACETATCIACAGNVNDRRLLKAANIPGFHEQGFDLDADILQPLGMPCGVLINDANAAGRAEVRFGAGLNKAGPKLFLCIGTGLGSAMFDELGRIVPGRWELGQVATPNNMGILEKYVSGPGILEKYQSHTLNPEGTSQGLISAWHSPEESGVELITKNIVRRAADYLGYALQFIAQLHAPETIIIGGGFGMALGQKFCAALQDKCYQHMGDRHKDLAPIVVSAELGDHAGMIGAAFFAHKVL